MYKRKISYIMATTSLTCTCVVMVISMWPYWIHSGVLEVHQGLFVRCVGLKCVGFWTDNFHWGKFLPWWHILSMLTYGLGFLLVYITERLQMMFGVRMCRINIFLLVCAFISTGLAMTLYGTMASKYWYTQISADPNVLSHFSWGYWSGVAASFLCLITSALYTCAHYAPTPGGWIKPDIGYG